MCFIVFYLFYCNLLTSVLQPRKQTPPDPVLWWAGVRLSGKRPCTTEGEGRLQESHGSWFIAARGESQCCSVAGGCGPSAFSGTFPGWMALGGSPVSTQHGRAAWGWLGSSGKTRGPRTGPPDSDTPGSPRGPALPPLSPPAVAPQHLHPVLLSHPNFSHKLPHILEKVCSRKKPARSL